MASSGFPDPTKLPQSEMREFLQGLLANPNLLPESFLGFMVDYLSINQPSIPISLVEGFSQWKGWEATAEATTSTTSTSYTDLGGPSLTGIAKGTYMIWFGCLMEVDADIQGAMSISVNGATAVDGDNCQGGVDGLAGDDVRITLSRALSKTLTGSNNSIAARYRSITGGTITYKKRYILALRIGN